jgi:hypothetical protein
VLKLKSVFAAFKPAKSWRGLLSGNWCGSVPTGYFTLMTGRKKLSFLTLQRVREFAKFSNRQPIMHDPHIPDKYDFF